MNYFVFCIHNHQPVGNFPEVIEQAYQRSYRPFLEAISKFPSVKLTLHNTGFLLDWIVENHPEYVELLREMVSTGQAEVMGGGYYEPILTVIPEPDRTAQIDLMSDRIESLFGARPRGIWLAERVWEPMLPTVLARCGIEYLVVDDYHFRKSGLAPDTLGGYYVTEDQGNVIKVFPGSEKLRYLIPFTPVEEFTAHMRSLDAFLARGDAAIYGDDGEKFGVWPGTHKWVFEDGWMEDFLATLAAEIDGGRVASETMGEYSDTHDPLGRVYLPTSSYMEMGEWTLPAPVAREYAELHKEVKSSEEGGAVEKFLQGGIWRNFLAKYPESNWMHKRMLHVSKALNERAGGGKVAKRPKGRGRVDIEFATGHLYRAQCNDAYWHGVFGGLYMPHLREAVYGHLIEAEKAAGLFNPGPAVELLDIDSDSRVEAVVRGGDLSAYLKPSDGGTLVELDFLPRAVNLCNTVARWPEGYHHRLEEGTPRLSVEETRSIHDVVLVKEEGLENYLRYDKLPRASLRDHFLDPFETLDAFYDNAHVELGDFHDGPYGHRVAGASLVLHRDGAAAGRRISVTKTVTPVPPDILTVAYNVVCPEPEGPGPVDFAVEFNLLLPCCEGPVCSYATGPTPLEGALRGLGSRGELEGTTTVTLSDGLIGLEVAIESSRPATLWRFPVHTVSLSEAGFEKIYQGSCLVFIYPFDGASGMDIEFEIKTRAT